MHAESDLFILILFQVPLALTFGYNIFTFIYRLVDNHRQIQAAGATFFYYWSVKNFALHVKRRVSAD